MPQLCGWCILFSLNNLIFIIWRLKAIVQVAHNWLGPGLHANNVDLNVHLLRALNSPLFFCIAEGSACAVVFDCKFIETSASLHHNVQDLFEGIVRQIRLRKDSKEENARRMANCRRRESIGKKAKRFLGRMVARKNKKMAFRQKSKSCHDLTVLWGTNGTDGHFFFLWPLKTRRCVCFNTNPKGLIELYRNIFLFFRHQAKRGLK